MLAVMGQFAPNYTVTEAGPIFNPATQANILYPFANNMAQQILAASGQPISFEQASGT
jgi:hypothetical protein